MKAGKGRGAWVTRPSNGRMALRFRYGSWVQVSIYQHSNLAFIPESGRQAWRIQRRVRVTGRPAFRRASMDEANISSVSLLPGYVSSCSSDNSTRGSSPSSILDNERLPLSPSLMLRVFTLLNDLIEGIRTTRCRRLHFVIQMIDYVLCVQE